jgi:enoyl-CoA hydratase
VGEASTLVRRDRLEPGIAVLTLARPEKRNALSVALRDELAEHLDDLADDPDLRVAVITAEGDVFCSGFDLGEFERAFADEAFAATLWASSDRYHRRVLTFPLPTIAAVHGPAIAGGFDLAVMCDLRIVSPTARFAHPEYTFGDVVYGPLCDLVGGAVARELTMTGREVDAAEALALRLVNEVVDPPLPRALEIAARVARGSGEHLRRTKAKALRRAGTVDPSGTLDL